jgi:hypothetical protein
MNTEEQTIPAQQEQVDPSQEIPQYVENREIAPLIIDPRYEKLTFVEIDQRLRNLHAQVDESRPDLVPEMEPLTAARYGIISGKMLII